MDQNFWDKVYTEKSEKEVSWFQENPVDSMKLIRELNLSKEDSIIDIGAGDSRLIDYLLEDGFERLTALDISEVSLKKLKERLAEKSAKVEFIVSDVTKFQSKQEYDLWHDRATFHFLTRVDLVEQYLEVASRSLKSNGNLIVSTFSKNGPEKCSGLAVHQYSETELKTVFSKYFKNIKCFETTHTTPWGSSQSFVYCGFKKK